MPDLVPLSISAVAESQASAPEHVAEEAADLLYFMLVACVKVRPVVLGTSSLWSVQG